MNDLTREQRREMKLRWHAWRKANPDKDAEASDMIEKGYDLNVIMERLGGNAPTASASGNAAPVAPPASSAKAMWDRTTARYNASRGFK